MISNFELNQMQTWPSFEYQIASYSSIDSMNQINIQDNFDVYNLIQKYCLCDIWTPASCSSYLSNHSDFTNLTSMNETQLRYYSSSLTTSSNTNMTPNQYNKRRFLDTIDFQSFVETLLSTIKRVTNENKVVVHGKRKSTARVRVSNRRSHYTGVFKNGDNWQALISIQKRKTYIGTYTSELEAAKAFDFYSILLNNITANTNFDYTKKDIIEMIEKFVLNDGKYSS